MLISLEESDFYQNTFNLATIYLWVYDVSYTCSRHFLINNKVLIQTLLIQKLCVFLGKVEVSFCILYEKKVLLS